MKLEEIAKMAIDEVAMELERMDAAQENLGASEAESAANLTDGVDLSGAKNLGERLAATTPYLTLNNRILMPIVGLSADKFDDLKDKNALGAALGLGYRLIDTDGGARRA